MKFYVPTYGRAGRVRLDVLTRLCDDVVLCVRDEELDEYANTYGSEVSYLNLGDVSNIAETRTRMCRIVKDDVWAMVDDDISGFYRKKEPERFGGVAMCSAKYVRSQLTLLEQEARYSLEHGVLCAVGVPDRVTLARPHGQRIFGAPLRQFVVMNKLAAKCAHYRTPILSDIDVSIQWMKVRGSNVYNCGDLGQSSSATAKTKERGGCGEYRERHPSYYAQAARALARYHKGFVRVVDGKPRVAWAKLRYEEYED